MANVEIVSPVAPVDGPVDRVDSDFRYSAPAADAVSVDACAAAASASLSCHSVTAAEIARQQRRPGWPEIFAASAAELPGSAAAIAGAAAAGAGALAAVAAGLHWFGIVVVPACATKDYVLLM